MAANMTTPRPHAELAARYYADDTLKCWYRRNPNREWTITSHPAWDADGEYHVGHEPPSIKRTITLVVNGREWVLPEPLKEAPLTPTHWEVNYGKAVECGWYGRSLNLYMLQRHLLYATEADAQAWAEFDKWCRGQCAVLTSDLPLIQRGNPNEQMY